jgi:hypothetical protein
MPPQDENNTHGIVFPPTPGGERSTTATSKAIWSAALRTTAPHAAEAITAERKWRTNYPTHVRQLVETSVQSSSAALAIAEAGLEALYGQFLFGQMPIREAMSAGGEGELHTAVIRGTAERKPTPLTIPYQGELLHGERLLAQIGQWERLGIIESSHATGLRSLHAHPEWLDLSNMYFVLLGAGAEMGPLLALAEWGANIIAVDLPRPAVWKRIVQAVQNSSGVLYAPVRQPHLNLSAAELPAHAGADLLTETPAIGRWLASLPGPLVMGGYAYLDGQMHVRVALAMDAIMESVLAVRADVALAFLATPTNVFAIPAEAAEMAKMRFEQWGLAKLWQAPLRTLSGRRFFEPNVSEIITTAEGWRIGITDALVLQQGPNYALAKRLQQWRAITARNKGVRVSANVAPATTTQSVIKNIALAAAYAGADHFGVEIFRPETSNALMAALLVHDLRYPEALANPIMPLPHPFALLMEGANHGGLWRVAFASRSVMEIAALLGWRASRGRAGG